MLEKLAAFLDSPGIGQLLFEDAPVVVNTIFVHLSARQQLNQIPDRGLIAIAQARTQGFALAFILFSLAMSCCFCFDTLPTSRKNLNTGDRPLALPDIKHSYMGFI